jgi:hypothetical protein
MLQIFNEGRRRGIHYGAVRLEKHAHLEEGGGRGVGGVKRDRQGKEAAGS